MVEKHILCPDRLRRVPKQFSWVDHRLVRDKHICGLSHESLALYLFLVTVGDADGLSYYSDAAIKRYLKLDAAGLVHARGSLCRAKLVAHQRPLYQVLSLKKSSAYLSTVPCEYPRVRRNGEAVPIGQLLGSVLGGVQ